MFTNGTLMLRIIRFWFVHVFFFSKCTAYFSIWAVCHNHHLVPRSEGCSDPKIRFHPSFRSSCKSIDLWLVKVLRNIMGSVLDWGTWVWFSCTFVFCILTFLPIPFHWVTIHAKSVPEPSSPSHKPLALCRWCHSNELLVHDFHISVALLVINVKVPYSETPEAWFSLYLPFCYVANIFIINLFSYIFEFLYHLGLIIWLKKK